MMSVSDSKHMLRLIFNLFIELPIQYLINNAQAKRLASFVLPALSIHFEENIMKKVIIASLAAMFVLTGCNTFKGFGQDVSSAGDAVTGTAKEVQKKI